MKHLVSSMVLAHLLLLLMLAELMVKACGCGTCINYLVFEVLGELKTFLGVGCDSDVL